MTSHIFLFLSKPNDWTEVHNQSYFFLSLLVLNTGYFQVNPAHSHRSNTKNYVNTWESILTLKYYKYYWKWRILAWIRAWQCFIRFGNIFFNILLLILFFSSAIRAFNLSLVARGSSEHLVFKVAPKSKFKSVKSLHGPQTSRNQLISKNDGRNCMVSRAMSGWALSCWNQTLISLHLRRVMKSVLIHLYVSVVIVELKKIRSMRHGTPFTHF